MKLKLGSMPPTETHCTSYMEWMNPKQWDLMKRLRREAMLSLEEPKELTFEIPTENGWTNYIPQAQLPRVWGVD